MTGYCITVLSCSSEMNLTAFSYYIHMAEAKLGLYADTTESPDLGYDGRYFAKVHKRPVTTVDNLEHNDQYCEYKYLSAVSILNQGTGTGDEGLAMRYLSIAPVPLSAERPVVDNRQQRQWACKYATPTAIPSSALTNSLPLLRTFQIVLGVWMFYPSRTGVWAPLAKCGRCLGCFPAWPHLHPPYHRAR